MATDEFHRNVFRKGVTKELAVDTNEFIVISLGKGLQGLQGLLFIIKGVTNRYCYH